ncbi:MAG: Fe-S cluster assembly protein SufD [Proteobacteria bacterium]|nr:MAG: Fe-S cluster assembly protein SufD [Pseudomonadota bacterium]
MHTPLQTEWLEIARNQAEERYRSLPLPTAKDEAFRFTPIADLDSNGGETGGAVGLELSTLDPEEAALLLLNGEEASLQGSAPGLVFTDLLKAVTLGIDHVRARLRDSAAVFAGDKFAQLSSARWRNGAFLHVPAGVKVAKPLRAATAVTDSEEHSRFLIVLEEGAEATFVQESWSPEGDRLATELTEVRLGKNSKLHWVQVQRYGSGTKAMVRQHVELGEGSDLKITPIHLGAGKIQVRQEIVLSGEGSQVEVEGAARGSGNQHFDFWMDIDHAASRTKSQTNFWFVMGDASRSIFNGLIHIRKHAQDCEAGQRAKSLLLGTKATVHAIPKLIIQTDAVKCAHGASVSSVNPEQVHYLQSRGISKPEAERMIVRGFTEPVLVRLPTEELQARAEAALDRKQGGLLQ